MKRRRFFKGLALMLAMALVIVAIPTMATESVESQPDEDVVTVSAGSGDVVVTEGSGDIVVSEDSEDIVVLSDLEEDSPKVLADVSISVAPEKMTLQIGDTAIITATINPEDETNQNVVWSSSDPSIVTVEDGKVQAIAVGEATVTAALEEDGSIYATCAVTVEPILVTEVELEEKEVTMEIGESYPLGDKVNITPDNATNKELSWSSNDETVVTVDENGTLQAVAAGEAEVTATTTDGSNISATCKVTVVNGPEVEGVTLSDSSLTMNINETYTLTATVSPSTAANQEVTWSSLDESKVKVDQNGKLTPVAAGKATITATSVDNPDCSASCTVTVKVYSGFQQALDGNWYYYSNGSVDTSITTVKKGTVNGTSGWWNVVKGMVTPGVTVAKNDNGWWYIDSSGMVDFSYNGFASNSNGNWYCENGKVDFSVNSVLKDTTGAIGTKGTWYYVVRNKVQYDFTGLANYKNSNGWWYIKNGVVDFTASGVYKNQNGWYYVDGGKVNFSYNGFAKNSNGSWYIEGGKVRFDKNSVIKDTTGALGTKGTWYYVVGSKVQYDFTGLANYKNSNGWWYIKNGVVDFTHNGVDKNKNGWWYVTGGKVQFGFTGLANYKNDNGWWYIKNGKVDFSASGVYKNNNGWYYVSGGKVDFSFNGIASNSNGRWVIKNGKVDFSYNGTYTYGGSTYNVTNGKATFSYESMGMSTSMYNKAQSQSSSTRWLIMVDVDNCKLGIFQGSYGNWTPYKCWDCTTGASGSPTCRGTYTIYGKGYSFGDDDHTCYYYNQFNGNYLIHSILYYPGTFNVKDGRLGMHLSNGCVRLSLDNAKWVYDNVPYSTRVVTY